MLNDTSFKFTGYTLHSFASFLNCCIDDINLTVFIFFAIFIQFLFKFKFSLELINLPLNQFVSFLHSIKFEALRSLNYFDTSDNILYCCRHLFLQFSSLSLLFKQFSFFSFSLLCRLSWVHYSSHI